MKTVKAIKLAGGRKRLAELLGVASITTYHWKPSLPMTREWQLRVLRPDWFPVPRMVSVTKPHPKPNPSQVAKEKP